MIWEKVAVAGQRKAALSLSSFVPLIFVFALSQLRGPDYLRAWNRLQMRYNILSLKQTKKTREQDEILESLNKIAGFDCPNERFRIILFVYLMDFRK